MEKNPFELPVYLQLALLRWANEVENWEIPEEVFHRLQETAPKWPEGRLAFRSLRIRFGEGDEGVALTFERHVKRIKEIFGEKDFWCWPTLLSGKYQFMDEVVVRLRLLNGNETHKPTVEWITIDLDANRRRESITAVRGPRSLADELFVFTWLFPDYIRSINYEENPGIIAAGYELYAPTLEAEVPYVSWYRGVAKVELNACRRSNGNSSYSVPVLRE